MSDAALNGTSSCRLSAVVFADMVGYSSFRQDDALRKKEEMMTLAVEQLERHGGRLVKTLGDGFLCVFLAANNAMSFALALQEAVSRRNARVGAWQHFRLRIGVHVGEVVVRGDDIEGTTVNIASRTEALAAPGGICLTEEVWQQVAENLPRAADRLGHLQVKGIKRRLCFYHVHAAGTGTIARWTLRGRLFVNWPGRLPAALLGAALIVALAVWLRPFAPTLLDQLFPRGPTQLAARAAKRLERYDLPGNIDTAIRDLRGALQQDAALTEAHALLGLAYWRRYRWTKHEDERVEAWRYSSNALACNQDSIRALFVQGLVAQQENRLAEATNFLSRANDQAKWENGEVLIELAKACRRLSDISNSVGYIEKAHAVLEKPWYFFNSLGLYEFSLGHREAAQTNLEQATRIASDSPTAWFNLGQVLLSRDQRARALICYQKSLRLAPSELAHDGLGEFYLASGDWQAAADNFRAAARLNPSRYDFPGKVGLALLRLPNAQNEAQEQLEKAVDKAQSSLKEAWTPDVAANLGLYQAGLGDITNAYTSLRKALEASPNGLQVRANVLSAVELLAQRQPEAAKQLRQLLDNRTDNK